MFLISDMLREIFTSILGSTQILNLVALAENKGSLILVEHLLEEHDGDRTSKW